MAQTEEMNETLITLTADIVSAHVSNNSVAVSDLPVLIQNVHNALTGLGGVKEVPEVKPEPAVSVRSSIKPDYIVCLEDGKKLKMLKRHLMTHYGMTPDEYRQKWGLAADYPKVARVFLNRLAIGMDLQSDATVAYGTGNTHTVTTTDAERNDASDPYNTYQHAGLPVGPISNPGDLAINAAVHPADGTWLYFVTVNLKTGDTVFSTTYADHEAAVAQWQQWMKENPSYG